MKCIRKKKISQKGYGNKIIQKKKRILIPKRNVSKNIIPKRIRVRQLYKQKKNPKKQCVKKRSKYPKKDMVKGDFTESCATV